MLLKSIVMPSLDPDFIRDHQVALVA